MSDSNKISTYVNGGINLFESYFFQYLRFYTKNLELKLTDEAQKFNEEQLKEFNKKT
ncbi:hypothetical protein ['Camptotheca acuminata' phytoplasma]|uniref:hypothetical protein n=1 Tax='Camptotheca acuminata' phytoplasma TaxID=3239192 RepID=UPI00351A8DEE